MQTKKIEIIGAAYVAATSQAYLTHREVLVIDDITKGIFDPIIISDIPKKGGYPANKKLPKGNYISVKPTSLIGRNDPCICGSGKKYKHCCLKKQ